MKGTFLRSRHAHGACASGRVARLPAGLLGLEPIWERTAGLAVQELGKRQDVTSQRERDVLGWKPHSLEEMVVAMAENMTALHVVRARVTSRRCGRPSCARGSSAG